MRTEDSLPRIPLPVIGGDVAYPGAKIDNTELGEAFAAYKAHCSMIHPESNPDDKTTSYCNGA